MNGKWNLRKIKQATSYLDLHDALYFFVRDQMQWEEGVMINELTTKPNKAKAIEEYLHYVIQMDALIDENITLSIYKTDNGLKFKKIHHINYGKNE